MQQSSTIVLCGETTNIICRLKFAVVKVLSYLLLTILFFSACLSSSLKPFLIPKKERVEKILKLKKSGKVPLSAELGVMLGRRFISFFKNSTKSQLPRYSYFFFCKPFFFFFQFFLILEFYINIYKTL